MRRLAVIAAAVAAWALAPAGGDAAGSVLVARDATRITLAVDGKGRALVTYRAGGKLHRVLAWGAVDDAIDMRLDYAGGYGAFGAPVWKTFRDVSRPYTGPRLPYLVRARTAPDGSHWALQVWRRSLPNQGAAPRDRLDAALELRLSHWQGELPKLEAWAGWVMRGRYRHLFGRLTYRGEGVFGYRNTPSGVPLDPYSRNVYLDTYDSAYGPGWERENAFLTHRPRGNFCYGFYPRGSTPGIGSRYRLSAIGPGATPDVTWIGADPGEYDAARDADLNAVGRQIAGDDPRCQKP